VHNGLFGEEPIGGEVSPFKVAHQGIEPADRSLPVEAREFFTQEWVDDLVLKAHFVAPVWSDYALVSERPSIWEIARDAQYNVEDRFVLVADDSLVVASENSVEMLMTVSPVAADDTVLYQISLHAFKMNKIAFFYAMAFHNLAFSYGLTKFHDSDLIDQLRVWQNGEGAEAYIAHPARKRPVFIFRRSTMLPTRIKAFHQGAKLILSGFGVVVVNDSIFRRYRDAAEDSKYGVIAIDPAGKVWSPSNEMEGLVSFGALFETSNLQTPLQPLPAATLQRFAINAWTRMSSTTVSIEERRELAEDYREFWFGLLQEAAQPEAGQPAFIEDLVDSSYPDIDAPVLPAPKPLEVDEDGYPLNSIDISAWADLKLSEALVILPRARRALSKARHPDPRRIAEALEVLAGPKLRGYRGERGTMDELDDALVRLRLRDGFSNADYLKGQTGEAYIVDFQGRRLLLERHLCSNSSGFNDPRMIRIYYFYHKATRKIVVGWLPSHLPTTQS